MEVRHGTLRLALGVPRLSHPVLDADEVFLTGTSAEVVPVLELDGKRYPVGPVTRELQATYQELVHGKFEAHRSWLTVA